MNDLPLYSELIGLGWTLYSHSGNRQHASYFHGDFPGVSLDVLRDARGSVSGRMRVIVGAFVVDSGEFSPVHTHRLFNKWLRDMVLAKTVLTEAFRIQGGPASSMGDIGDEDI